MTDIRGSAALFRVLVHNKSYLYDIPLRQELGYKSDMESNIQRKLAGIYRYILSKGRTFEGGD